MANPGSTHPPNSFRFLLILQNYLRQPTMPANSMILLHLRTHNPKVSGSNPAPATNQINNLKRFVGTLGAQLDAPWIIPLLPARCVSQKTSELGICMALSVQSDHLLQLTLYAGLRLRPALFGHRPWLAVELRANTHLPGKDFRHCRRIQHIGSASR